MSTTTPRPEARPLSTMAAQILWALNRLHDEITPHHSGGFTQSDIQMRLGMVFRDPDTLADAIAELRIARFIVVTGRDEAENYAPCYAIG